MARHATAAIILAGALACAGSPLEPTSLGGRDAPAGVRVRLAFADSADLDLHVTDPLHETIYFANTPAASGGVLESDVRCDSEGPRIETVSFADPPAGRYRVGIDFPIRCRQTSEPARFVLEVWAGGIRHELRGAIPFGRFEPVVYEFDVEGTP